MTYNYTLITGASSGIGKNLSYEFAKNGFNLILVARNLDNLNAIKTEIMKNYPVDVIVKKTDLLKTEAVEELYNWITKKKYNIEYLVNCAGFGSHGKFSEIDKKIDLDMISLNIYDLTNLSKLFLPNMLKNNCGGILNVASIAGFLSGPYMAVYYATKSYVISLTESLASENNKSNLKFSALCPGPVATDFFKTAKIDILANPKRYKFIQTPEKIAKLAYKKFMKGKTIIAPFPYSFVTAIALCLPRKIRLNIIKNINRLTDL